jgi:transposase-like protein
MPIICPFCSYTRSWSIRRNKRKCKKCRHEFSSNKYPVKGIHSDKNDWEKCIKIFLRERACLRISDETGINHCRVAKMIQLLRECMFQDDLQKFSGPVELDETYIGGQRKNKRLHIRRIKSKRGHGTEKLPILGIFDRHTGQVYVQIMPIKLNINFIFHFAKKQLKKGIKIYTDGYKMYRGFTKEGFIHEYVDHDGGEYVRGEIHTNNIEGFWGILKRKLSCVGGMRRKYLYLFVAEIAWKFNHRKDSLQKQEQLLLKLIAEFGGRS